MDDLDRLARPPRRLLGRLPGPGAARRRPGLRGVHRPRRHRRPADRNRTRAPTRIVPPGGQRAGPLHRPARGRLHVGRADRSCGASRPRPHVDDRRRPLPLRPDDPLRDPVPRLGHGHRRRRDVHGRRARTARPLVGRAGLVGLWMVLVLHAPRRRHPGPPGRHPHEPRHPGLLWIYPAARAGAGASGHGAVGHRRRRAPRIPIQGPYRDHRRRPEPRSRLRPHADRPRRDAGRLRARAPAQRRRPHQPVPPGHGHLPDRRRPHRRRVDRVEPARPARDPTDPTDPTNPTRRRTPEARSTDSQHL